jgi:hypothetical protein
MTGKHVKNNRPIDRQLLSKRFLRQWICMQWSKYCWTLKVEMAISRWFVQSQLSSRGEELLAVQMSAMTGSSWLVNERVQLKVSL